MQQLFVSIFTFKEQGRPVKGTMNQAQTHMDVWLEFSTPSGEDQRLRLSENEVGKKTFRPKREKIIGGQKKLHNE
jgi:dihydrodipicolinate reductase